MRGKGNNGNNCEGHECNTIKCFQCEGWGHRDPECLSSPLNGNEGEVPDASNLPPKMCNQVKGSQGHQ